MTNLYKKLFNLQSEIGAITKDATNPFFKSKYFDINSLLSELKPLLTKEGLVILQALTIVEGKPALETSVIEVDSGENKVSICPLPENSDPQKMGSIITYFRRYSLQSLLLLQAEDDDANAGATPSKPVQQATTHKPVEANKEVPFISGDKIEGGQCPNCGLGKIVKSPKSGKLYCAEKCWLPKQ